MALRSFVVHMSDYQCLNGAPAGPFRVSGDADTFGPAQAVAAALYTWSPTRVVTRVLEQDSVFADDDEGTEVPESEWALAVLENTWSAS